MPLVPVYGLSDMPRALTSPNPHNAMHAAYTRMAPSLFRYALMLLANHHEAEDAVQQVFIALAARGLTGIESLDRYLRTAVRNECYTMIGQRRVTSREDDGPLLEALPAAEVDTERRLALEQGIRALPPEQREVVHLKAFEGRTFQEIADLTGESINTSASRYRYAIEKLRAAFGVEANHGRTR